MLRTALALTIALLRTQDLRAQATPTATVIGILTDVSSGRAIAGAEVRLSTGNAVTSSDEQGRFALSRVPLGEQEVIVRRFGYRELRTQVSVSDPMGGLQLRMSADPVQLEELAVAVRGSAEAPVTGVVRDAATGQAIPFAEVKVGRGIVPAAGRTYPTDADGSFRVPSIRLGEYLLRVERFGYAPRLLAFVHTLPGQPIEVALEPNVLLLEGIVATVERTAERVKGWGYTTTTYDEDRLKHSAAPDMEQFVLGEAGLVGIVLDYFVDEMKVLGGMREFRIFSPSNFYRIEFFACPRVQAGPAMSGSGSIRVGELRAYTYAYVEKVALRAQALLPPCTRGD